MGSHVAGQSAEHWREAFVELHKAGELEADGKNLFQQLRISYDGLNEQQKEMFLDVACNMIGWSFDYAKEIWKR